MAARFYARAASRALPTPICGTRGTAISAGAPTARCGSSIGFIRIWLLRKDSLPRRPLAPPVQQLDVASVVKASQALSSEIVLPKLIERLMTIALENAGADRGLLILPAEDEHLIQAEARGRRRSDRSRAVPRAQSPASLVPNLSSAMSSARTKA